MPLVRSHNHSLQINEPVEKHIYDNTDRINVVNRISPCNQEVTSSSPSRYMPEMLVTHGHPDFLKANRKPLALSKLPMFLFVLIVFSGFVLVIQEKDLVQLKVVKQLLRRSLRRERELSEKLERYKVISNDYRRICSI